MVMGSAIT